MICIRNSAASPPRNSAKEDTSDKAPLVALTLLAQGWGWRTIAEATGVQNDTLRHGMADAGMLSQNPSPATAA